MGSHVLLKRSCDKFLIKDPAAGKRFVLIHFLVLLLFLQFVSNMDSSNKYSMFYTTPWYRNSKIIVFCITYLSFLLDNVLLTVIVPIIPDYLFSHEINTTRSLSPLQRKFENIERDNGPLGALLASKAFVQLAFTPVIGYFTEILGYNIPLLLGSFNMLLATLLFAYGKSYSVLVLARALHGSASAAIAVSGMCLLADTLSKESRNKLMPLTFGGIALGVLIGYPLGGAAYQFISKSAPFILIAFLITCNILLQIYNLKHVVKEDSEAEEEEEVIYNSNSLEWIKYLKSNYILIIIGAITISTTAMAILEPCVPMWLLATINPPPTKWQLGAVFIPDSIGYFLGSHFASLIPMVPWRNALAAMLISGLACCAVPLATTISGLSFPHFALGLGVGIVDAALVPLLANFVDETSDVNEKSRYGPVYSMQQAAVCLAYSLGPLLGGKMITIIGFPWLIRIIGLLNIIYCPILTELSIIELKRSSSASLLHRQPSQQANYSTLEESSLSPISSN